MLQFTFNLLIYQTAPAKAGLTLATRSSRKSLTQQSQVCEEFFVPGVAVTGEVSQQPFCSSASFQLQHLRDGSTLLLSACYCTGNDFSVRFHKSNMKHTKSIPQSRSSLMRWEDGLKQISVKKRFLVLHKFCAFPRILDYHRRFSCSRTSKWYLPWISVNFNKC